MKKLIIALISCLTLHAYSAPLYKKQQAFLRPNMEIPFSVLDMQMEKSRSAQKSTGVMRRMIANSYYHSGSIVDSNRYYYSNGRGSANTTPESYYSYYTLTSNNQENTLPCDSFMKWRDGGGGLEWIATNRYEYNTQNNVTAAAYESPDVAFKNTGQYNSNGQLKRINTIDSFGGTQFSVKSTMYVIYDNRGRRILDSTYSLVASANTGRREYKYDNNDNLLEFTASYFSVGQWTIFNRMTYTYDMQNRMITQITEYDQGSGITPTQKDSFSYTGNNIAPTTRQAYMWDNNIPGWVDYEIMDYTFGSNGKYDGYTIYRYNNGWDTIEHDIYVYDSNDLLVRANGYLYMGNGQFNTTPYDQSTLYFEDYYPASVLNNIDATTEIQLYPNPSTDIINIKTSSTADKIKIVSLNGIVVREHNATGQQTSIDITQLPPGNYIAVATAKNGNATGYARFIKQ